jgi:hypothetical protein
LEDVSGAAVHVSKHHVAVGLCIRTRRQRAHKFKCDAHKKKLHKI